MIFGGLIQPGGLWRDILLRHRRSKFLLHPYNNPTFSKYLSTNLKFRIPFFQLKSNSLHSQRLCRAVVLRLSGALRQTAVVLRYSLLKPFKALGVSSPQGEKLLRWANQASGRGGGG